MPWAKIDDRFPRHPKVLRAGGNAAWLYVAGLCYCNEHLTDGVIPASAIRSLTDLPRPDRLALRLCSVGLWDPHGEDFMVHDYLDENDPADVVLAKRAALSERRRVAGVAGGHRSGEARREAKTKQVASSNEANDKQRAKQTSNPDADADADAAKKQDPPVSPVTGGATTPDLFGQPSPPPPVKAPTRAQVKAAEREKHDAEARTVLAALSEARIRAIPGALALTPTVGNLRGIASRLADGATVDQCLHVIAVREAATRADPSQAQWFDAVTPFTVDGFARDVGKPVGMNGARPRVVGMAPKCGSDVAGDG